MEKAVKILKTYCGNGEKIAVAVSGGSDSMALLFCVLNCDFISKENVSVININHKIRGKNSDGDSAFVKRICAQFGVELTMASVDVPARVAASGRSVEYEAREARHELFAELNELGSVKYVLTAHHAADNAETVLMHILRGCGISGLRGMEICSRGFVLRPLLTTDKEEISEFIKANNIEFVTDESNFDDSYDRNFIRLKVMPLLKSRYEGCEGALNRLAQIAEQAEKVLKSEIDETAFDKSNLERGIVRVKSSALVGGNGYDYVYHAVKMLGADSDFYFKHAGLALQLLNGKNGARLSLGANIAAVKEYDYLTFIKGEYYRCNNNSCNNTNCERPFKIGSIELDGAVIKVELACGNILKNVDRKDNNSLYKELAADFTKFPIGCVIRYRQAGDEFTPFGGGTKKLKEYLIDKKIPLRLRDKIPLVCYNKTVLAVIGVEISDKVKLESGEDNLYGANAITIKYGEISDK